MVQATEEIFWARSFLAQKRAIDIAHVKSYDRIDINGPFHGRNSRSAPRVNFRTLIHELLRFLLHSFFQGLSIIQTLLGRIFADVFSDFH